MSGAEVYMATVTMPREKARAIVDGAFAKATADGVMPLAVVVLDAGGHPVAMERQDGAGIVRPEVAAAKAWGALGFGVSSAVLGERLSGRDAFQSAVAAASGGRFAAVPGGVLVVDAQQRIIGAVGISGDASPVDEACAVAGIEAAGLSAAPSAP